MDNEQVFEIRYFHIPCGSKENAKIISDAAIQSRLAACTHISEVNSNYQWNDELQSEIEFLLILKTISECSASLSQLVRKLHQFQVPCILMIYANVNEEYYRWMLTRVG